VQYTENNRFTALIGESATYTAPADQVQCGNVINKIIQHTDNKKRPDFQYRALSRLEFAREFSGFVYFDSFATRLDRRETFREPVFL
jgi:hypothetical protein